MLVITTVVLLLCVHKMAPCSKQEKYKNMIVFRILPRFGKSLRYDVNRMSDVFQMIHVSFKFNLVMVRPTRIRRKYKGWGRGGGAAKAPFILAN